MGLEELDQVSLVWFPDPFQLKYLAEIGVRFVGDVDKVRLDQRFWGGWAYLKSLQNWIKPGHGLRDPLDVAWRWRGVRWRL